MAEALTNTRGPSLSFAASRASSTRRPDPALVYLAFVASSKPAGDRYSREMDDGVGPRQDLRVGVFRVPGSFVGPPGARRTRRMTRWPPVDRNATSEEPTSPPEPVMATVRGVGSEQPCPIVRRKGPRPVDGAGRRT